MGSQAFAPVPWNSTLGFFFRCLQAQAAEAGEPFERDSVVLSFQGNGATAQVTWAGVLDVMDGPPYLRKQVWEAARSLEAFLKEQQWLPDELRIELRKIIAGLKVGN